MQEIMLDGFGNYLCQKIIERMSSEQVKTTIAQLSVYLPEICLNNHGTRAVQALIEASRDDPEKIVAFLDSIQVNMYDIILDIHGNHVIQSCISQFSPELTAPIFSVISANCFAIATHKHGCCVLQRFFEYGSSA